VGRNQLQFVCLFWKVALAHAKERTLTKKTSQTLSKIWSSTETSGVIRPLSYPSEAQRAHVLPFQDYWSIPGCPFQHEDFSCRGILPQTLTGSYWVYDSISLAERGPVATSSGKTSWWSTLVTLGWTNTDMEKNNGCPDQKWSIYSTIDRNIQLLMIKP